MNLIAKNKDEKNDIIVFLKLFVGLLTLVVLISSIAQFTVLMKHKLVDKLINVNEPINNSDNFYNINEFMFHDAFTTSAFYLISLSLVVFPIVFILYFMFLILESRRSKKE